MRLLLLGLLALCACGSDSRNPPGGGGGGPGGGGPPVPDANQGEEVDANTDVFVAGFACNVLELRSPRVCSGNPSGLTIGIRETAIGETETGIGGVFSIASPAETRVTLEVEADDAFTTTTLGLELADVPVSGVSMPVFANSEFDSLALELDTLRVDGTTTIALFLSNAGAAVAGASVLSVPTGTTGNVYYDQSGSPSFSASSAVTGPAGAILIFGVPSGVAPKSLMVSDGSQIATVSGIESAADGISFVFYDFAQASE